jgi:hypothetical protein
LPKAIRGCINERGRKDSRCDAVTRTRLIADEL